MWPTSEAGRLKFIIDLYFDDTISNEDKYLIISEKGGKYLAFYEYLSLKKFNEGKKRTVKNNNL